MEFLLNLAGTIVPFGLPFLVFVWPRVPRWPRHPFTRFVLVILAVWAFLIFHRLAVLPYKIAAAEARGNLDYDGVGLNAGILLFGWLFAIITTLPSLIIRGIAEGIAARREDRDQSKGEIVRQEPGTGEGWS